MLRSGLVGATVFSALSLASAQTSGSVSLPPTIAGTPAARSAEYTRVQNRLQQGWNTWDVNTIAGEVLLPEGLEIRLALKRNTTLNGDAFFPTVLIGRQGPGQEQVKPGPHAYNGSYNSFEVTWGGMTANVQEAHAGNDLVMLLTPVSPEGLPTQGSLPATAIFSVGFLWNHSGQVRKKEGRIVASSFSTS